MASVLRFDDWETTLGTSVAETDGSGNVALGGSSPSYRLDVTGDINASGAVRVGGNSIGEYTDYSGSITYNNLTLGNGSHGSSYARVGDFVHFYGYIVFGSTTSVTGAVQWSLPITAYQSAPLHPNQVLIENVGTALVDGAAYLASTTLVGAFAKYAGATYVEWQAVSASIPVGTWATNDKIIYDFMYRAA